MAAFLFIVGNSGSLVASDTAIKNLIEARGHTATVVDDGAAESLGAHAFVVIARSVSTAGMGTPKYSTAAVPVLLGSPMGMWNNFTTGGGALAGTTDSVEIMDAGSPLAGGFPVASAPVFTTAGGDHAIYVGPAAAGVVVVGRYLASPTLLQLIYAPSGATLVSGTAPALRIGIWWDHASLAALNANGLAIYNGGIQMIEADIGAGPPPGQPTMRRGRGVPGMRLGGTTFGQGF